MRRGPRDHHEAIIYMSCATPKNEGAGSSPWLTADWARVRRPPRRPGPWSRRSRKRPRSLSGGVAPRLEFREAGPRFPRQALLRASGPSREMVPTMLAGRGGADREIQTAITPLTPGALTRLDKRAAHAPPRRRRGSVYSGEWRACEAAKRKGGRATGLAADCDRRWLIS